jgi:hypothetical protein
VFGGYSWFSFCHTCRYSDDLSEVPGSAPASELLLLGDQFERLIQWTLKIIKKAADLWTGIGIIDFPGFETPALRYTFSWEWVSRKKLTPIWRSWVIVSESRDLRTGHFQSCSLFVARQISLRLSSGKLERFRART